MCRCAGTCEVNDWHIIAIPTYHNTIVRFIENLSGNKTTLQFYPFVNQSINHEWVLHYKLWLPRLNFYEKRLGHKFFLEESLHIIHLSFFLKDAKLFLNWLKVVGCILPHSISTAVSSMETASDAAHLFRTAGRVPVGPTVTAFVHSLFFVNNPFLHILA